MECNTVQYSAKNNLRIHKSGVPQFLVITNPARYRSLVVTTKVVNVEDIV